MSTESKHGLLRMGMSRSAIAHDSLWDTDPALCHRVITDVLCDWIGNTSQFLIDEGIIRVSTDCKKLMSLYLERSQKEIDTQTLALKCLYDSKMAKRALDSSNAQLKADKAAFHIWHATMTWNQLALLREEKIIQDGRKTAKNYRQGIARANAEKEREAQKRHQKWQTEASRIWEKSPDLSMTAVALIIKKQLNLTDSENTIRRKIKKLGKAK